MWIRAGCRMSGVKNLKGSCISLTLILLQRHLSVWTHENHDKTLESFGVLVESASTSNRSVHKHSHGRRKYSADKYLPLLPQIELPQLTWASHYSWHARSGIQSTAISSRSFAHQRRVCHTELVRTRTALLLLLRQRLFSPVASHSATRTNRS